MLNSFKKQMYIYASKQKTTLRFISLILTLSLLFTSLPLGGMVASAAEVNDENTIITVEKELTEYRTEYSKTYLMSNNTLESVISANPMHYKNDSGNWVDIDSTLVLEETEDGEVYKNKVGGYAVSFPATNENGSSVKIESGEHTIEIELVEGKKSHARKDTSNKNKAKKLTKEQRKLMTASELYAVDSNQNSALEYNDIYDNTNVRYDINPTSVKESVIITKAPNKKVSYSYNIKADGLMAELNDDGSISFYEKTDTKKQNAVFVMPAPLMYDANDIYCYDIETTLKQKKGVYVLTYKPDYNWLKAKDRAYPVVLDPTTYVANSTQDAYTYSADEYQNRNIGSENQIKVGRSTWKDPNGDTFETFIRFDELPTIPDGYVINSALLMLTTKAYHGTWQELEVGAHKITEDWTNKLNQPLPLITYLNQPDAESFPRATAHIVRGEVDTEVGFEISALVNEWYEDPTTNYGVKLSLAETPPTDADNVLFHSSRATSGIPYLSVTYDVRVPVTDIEITEKCDELDCSENGYNFEVGALVYPVTASDQRVNWQVADESVAFYYDGKIYARGNGETTVTAISVDDNTVTDSFDLEVTNIQAITAENFSVTNLPANNSLSLGNRCAVLAVAKDSNQQDIDISNENVAWVSSNEGIVTVNELGEITAKSVGTATITATFAGISTSFSITVKPEVFFELQSQYNYLLTEEEITFIGKFNPAGATDLRTTCSVISYSDQITNSEGVEEKEVVEVTRLSGDDAPATEYTQYKIKGLVPGKATLRLQAFNDPTIYKDLTIDVVTDNISLNEPYQNILLEGNTWTFSDNPHAQIKVANQSILLVQNGTTVKALKAGTTSVEVWLRDRGSLSNCTITVEENLNISITNKPVFCDSDGNEYANSIYIGQTYNSLKLTGNVSSITSINVISSDTTVANAYYDTAKARIVLDGLAVGTSEISVYINGNTVASDSFILNVKPLPIDGFFIEADNHSLEDGVLYAYETGMLALDVYPLEAMSSFDKADWYVYLGNKDTVSITPFSKYQVKVKAEKPGIVEIDAIINGKYANNTFPLTVKKPKINITRRPQNNKMLIGDTFTLGWNYEPSYATVIWDTENPNVASINTTEKGVVTITAKSKGSAKIYAVGKYKGCKFTTSFTIKVQPKVTDVLITNLPQNNALEIGETHTLKATILPEDAPNKSVVWDSKVKSVAEVNPSTGKITAKAAGTTTITVTAKDGGFVDSFQLWVKGKTPVFLIHGRISNSKDVWGINNNIPSGKNNHFDSNVNASASNGKKYINVDSQALGVFEANKGSNNEDYPSNLGNGLIDAGYKKNVNLFAFNYPNEDAVAHSAEKFKKYIENLISYVRTSGSNEMKACFYASKNDYDANNYKINIVGHSMGGLVARYYIENAGQDNYVDKLITICTPHWGSGYGYLSNKTGIEHKLCDHDLDFNSAMYGGSNSTIIYCDYDECSESSYAVTSELLYQRQRSTKYYAIAGIDYVTGFVNLNDHSFEMPTNFTTIEEITDYLVSKNVYKPGQNDFQLVQNPNPVNIGDNMVGFLSQIGWIGDSPDVNTPQPKIQMEKIFVDVDANGGNGGETFIWEALVEYVFGDALLHSKIPHRTPVIEKTIEFLGE